MAEGVEWAFEIPIRTKQPIHLIVDSTGLSIAGEGEWAAAKYGGRGKRAWKKLHIGIDESGLIVAEALTHGSADDAKAPGCMRGSSV
jgi:hypothetical protein